MQRGVVIRTDGSSRIGLGHVARMSTLAAAFARGGVKPTFVVHAASETAVRRLRSDGFEVTTCKAEPASSSDAADTAETARHAKADMTIVDGYQFSDRYFSHLQDAGVYVCYVDDQFARVAHCDAVLNNNVFADAALYPTPTPPTMLLGPEYALIADSFLAFRRPLRPGPSERLLVTMGGSDPTGQGAKVLEGLSMMQGQLAPLDVRIIAGPASAPDQIEALKRKASLVRRHRVAIIDATTAMAEQMAWADLTITAGGTTCLELACVGVPSLVIAVADNQRRVATGFDALGLMRSLGWHEEVGPDHIARAIADVGQDESLRTRMHAAQRALIDGEGKERVARALLAAVSAHESGQRRREASSR